MREYLLFMLHNAVCMMKRHKMLIILMVLLVAGCSYILGVTLEQGRDVQENIVDYTETYGKKTYYFTGEGMSDKKYYEYLDDNNTDDIERLIRVKKRLMEENQFSYMVLMYQPVEVRGFKMPDIFLQGYEDGESESSVFEYDGDTFYYTKCVQVSDNFFREFDIEVSEGQIFGSDDYVYEKNKKIPILLGKEFKKYFQIGDKLEGNYLFENMTWEVVGFLNDNAFFYNCMNEEFESCDRYIIMPALANEEKDYFCKIMLLQQMNGIIISDMGFPETRDLYENIFAREDMADWGFYMRDPKAAENANTLLETYSSMTDEVSRQFNVILGLTIAFAVASLSSVLCGFIKEKRREYGIHMLCGANTLQILGDIIFLESFVFISGSVLAILCLVIGKYTVYGMIGILITGVIVEGIVLAICYFYFRKIDLNEIIGGKE